MFTNITVAFDESDEGGRALLAAIALAKLLNASLAVISVIEPPPIYFSFLTSPLPYLQWTDGMRSKYTTLQSRARKLAEDSGIAITVAISSGDEIDSMLAAAKHNHSDLLVIGMPKHNWIIGRTGHQVADRAPCALLGILVAAYGEP